MGKRAEGETYYRIGEVAERTGLTQRTLRFYEERGLLPPPVRLESGFRLYTEEDIQRIKLVRQLQEMLGFSLSEIKEMVEAEEVRSALRESFRDMPPEKRRSKLQHAIEVTESQLRLITQKIDKLSEMREQWEQKIQHYRSHLSQLDGQLPQDETLEAQPAR
jgi:DNA-binding transcriptional MerR regulator